MDSRRIESSVSISKFQSNIAYEAIRSHLLSVMESLHQLNSPTFLTIHSFWSGMLRFSFKNGHVIQQRLTNLEKNMSRQPRSDHLNHDLVKDRFVDFLHFKHMLVAFYRGLNIINYNILLYRSI